MAKLKLVMSQEEGKAFEKEVDSNFEDKHPRDDDGKFAEKGHRNESNKTDQMGITAEKNIKQLSNILSSGNSQKVHHSELGEITIDKGETGKKGYGLAHIIQNRKAEGKNDKEIAAVLYLVVQAAKEGKITREMPSKNPARLELEKDGIIAILSLKRFQEDEKWLLTGFDNNEKKEGTTGAIQTVIAQYGHSPEFSDFRNQVGAVVSSLP